MEDRAPSAGGIAGDEDRAVAASPRVLREERHALLVQCDPGAIEVETVERGRPTGGDEDEVDDLLARDVARPSDASAIALGRGGRLHAQVDGDLA